MTYPQGPQDPRQWQTQPGYGTPPPYGHAPYTPPPPKRSSTGLVLIVIGAVLLALFGGCAVIVAVVGSSTPSGSTRQPAAGPGRVAKVGTPVRDGKFEFTVTGTEAATHVGGQILGETAKGVFVIVHLHVVNIGNEAQYFSGSDQKLIDDKGRQYAPDSSAAFYVKGSSSFLEQINPGLQVDGAVVFDMPVEAKASAIELHDSILSGGVRVALT